MNDIFVSKTKHKAQDIAKRLAKAAREETTEFKKSATQQISGEQPQRQSPVVEAMQQGVVPVTETQHENIHHDEKRRLDYLEKELEELRRKRKLEEEQKQMAAVQQQQSQTENKLLRPLEIPTSKPKRGLFGTKKKQGTKEMGKQISG